MPSAHRERKETGINVIRNIWLRQEHFPPISWHPIPSTPGRNKWDAKYSQTLQTYIYAYSSIRQSPFFTFFLDASHQPRVSSTGFLFMLSNDLVCPSWQRIDQNCHHWIIPEFLYHHWSSVLDVLIFTAFHCHRHRHQMAVLNVTCVGWTSALLQKCKN